MKLQFLAPEWLLTLALLGPVVWLGARDRRRLPRRRRWSILLRSAVLVVVVLALARPRLLLPVDARSVAFVLDVSDSVPPEERARAEEFVRQALEAMRPQDRAAVVVFGQTALIDRPARYGPLTPIRSVPPTGRTDIASALRLGTAILPADTARRVVLLSDGRANLGDLDRALDLALAAEVPIDVVGLAASTGPQEVLLKALEAPANSRVGQQFELTAVVWASKPTHSRLRIYTPQLAFDRDVTLSRGENRFSVPVTVRESGFRRFWAEIIPAGDGWRQNNRVAAYTVVAGEPRILVVAGEPARAGPLVSALQAAGRHPQLVLPAEMPTRLVGLAEYEAVVLVDVPARQLTGAMGALEAFVRDLGHGLVMIGGEDSFGAGGYRDTPVEKALPVEMEVRDREHRPDVALVFAIDKSGSMAGCDACRPGSYAGAGLAGAGRKVDLAKEAVAQAAALVRPTDRVGLVAFDDRAHRLWPLRQHQHPDRFESMVAGIQASGGTNIYAGLVAAVEELERSQAPVKHILLLTDGWSDASGYGSVLERMEEAKITLSIVAIGRESAGYLKELAEEGGGRYYKVEQAADVPQVFVEETMTALGTYVVEERFQPVMGSPGQLMAGLPAARLPPLNGYNATTEKQSARVALWSHLDDPLLAGWQYGLGRSVAWTSDLKRQWAADWVDWDSFGRFVVQLVDWTLPAPANQGFVAQVTLEGSTATLRLEASDQAGGALNGLQVEARLSGPSGQSLTVPLPQTGAGEYGGSVMLPEEGTYLLRVVGRQDGRQVGAQTSGIVLPYSPEYADPSTQPTDPRLWQVADASGGRILGDPRLAFASLGGVTRAREAWSWLFLLAALLFPLDVAVRRLKLGRVEVAHALAALRSRAQRRRRPVPAPRVLEGLFRARDRARALTQGQAVAGPGKGLATRQGGGPETQPAGGQSAGSDMVAEPRVAEEVWLADEVVARPGPAPRPSVEAPEEAAGPSRAGSHLARLKAAKERARSRTRRRPGRES